MNNPSDTIVQGQTAVSSPKTPGTTGQPRGSERPFASGGRLRVALNAANAAIVRVADDGRLVGVAPALADALACALGLELQLERYPSAGAVITAQPGSWDVAFIAVDAAREELYAFSPPYKTIAATLIVGGVEPGRAFENLDRPGARIGAAAGAAYETALRGRLQHAECVPYGTSADALDAFAGGALDAVAGVQEVLERFAAEQTNETSILAPFERVYQAIAIERRHGPDLVDSVLAAAARAIRSAGTDT